MAEFIPVRLSHLLGQSSVGAIVRGSDGLAVVQDTRHWTDRHGDPGGQEIPYVERVRSALGISQKLREPPLARELIGGQVDGVCIPVTQFPSWTRCPACGYLYRWPWRHEESGLEPRCKNAQCTRRPALEQVTWALAHEAGYLADVPWRLLAHRAARDPRQMGCQVQDHLALIDRNGRREIRCLACGSKNLFRGNEKVSFGQSRMQPWTKDDHAPPPASDKQGGTEQAEVLAVNDTRIHSPAADVALVIPPESRVRRGTVIDQLYRSSRDRERIDKARNGLARKASVKEVSAKYRCTPDEVSSALDELRNGYPLYGATFTPGQLRESEFQAFQEIFPDQRDDEDLVTRDQSDEWRGLSIESRVSRLVRVDRLKAIKVFRGFKRLGEGGELVPADIVGSSDWLPAVELYGEGIFLALDEERVQRWEDHPAVQLRLRSVLPRFAQSGRELTAPLTPRFMLLHTLSHLLMRQIEAEGGYPAASLVERIYCSRGPVPMAGVLIYVAVPDIAGSLGGLAELAAPRRFAGVLTRALEQSRWCSLDPVCSEHEGQGPGLLNRAACHACTLVPDPACEHGNILLDRGFVKGDEATGLPSFFWS